MIKDNSLTDKPPTQGETLRELFSDKKDGFIDALECLYIRNNQGGRLIFAEKCAAAAEKIFSEELVRYDHEGVGNDEDRQRRAELERESDELREAMLHVFDNLDNRLVIYGSLQVEELNAIMQKIDRPVAEYVFADRFVDKYFPKPAGAEGNPDAQAAPIEAQSAQGNVDREEPENQTHSEEAESLPKDIADIPEIQTNSIGHVDHTFSSTTPNYKQGEEGDDSENMRWLDAAEEDEFGGVQPISTEAAPSPSLAVNAPPPPLQEEDSESEAGLFDSVRQESAEQPQGTPAAANEPPPPEFPTGQGASAASADMDHAVVPKAELPEVPSIDETARRPEPEPEVPRRPMGMDGVRLAQEQSRAPEPPREQPMQQPPVQNTTPPARPPMGMGAVGLDQNAPEGNAPVAATEAQNEDKPAPRVPSLDDIDKHMSKSGSGSSDSQSEFPSIPGSEDD